MQTDVVSVDWKFRFAYFDSGYCFTSDTTLKRQKIAVTLKDVNGKTPTLTFSDHEQIDIFLMPRATYDLITCLLI